MTLFFSNSSFTATIIILLIINLGLIVHAQDNSNDTTDLENTEPLSTSHNETTTIETTSSRTYSETTVSYTNTPESTEKHTSTAQPPTTTVSTSNPPTSKSNSDDRPNLTFSPKSYGSSTSMSPDFKNSPTDSNGPGPVIITLSLIACLTIVAVIGFFVFIRMKHRIRGRNYFRQLDDYQDDLLDYEIGIDTNTSNFVLDDMDFHDNDHRNFNSRPHLA